MAKLIASRSVTLNNQTRQLQSPTVTVDPLTSQIQVRLQRPTTTQPLSWNSNSTIRVSLVFLVDGVEYRCVGQTSGGVRIGKDGAEVPEYVLTYHPTVLFGDAAREYIQTAVKDAEGYSNDVPLTRLGQTGSTVQGYLLLERIRGTINTVITIAATTEAPAPKIRYKNSVAFDATSTFYETGGDGVVSGSHTSSGSDRAVFAGVAIMSFAANPTSTSVTYGGSGMTEKWDRVFATYYGQAGYTLAGQATGAQTVTVTGVSTDGMVVDNVTDSSIGISSIGANQTQRGTHAGAGGFMSGASSTQSGADGGVMSWTINASGPWDIGAIEFKPVAASGQPYAKRLAGVPFMGGGSGLPWRVRQW